jgi:tetratricopeptide (TPR) repeat protein
MGEERLIPAPPPARRRVMELLDEVPTVLGLVLWQDVRHLRDWAESSAAQRAELFNPGLPTQVVAKRREARASAPELSGALDTFAALKADPVAADPVRLGVASAQVVDWALTRDFRQTAIEWAEVAAPVDPESPGLANLAGRLTRNANEYDRAELWFRRGLGFAREQHDTIELIRAHLGYGRLCTELGRIKGARTHLNRGSRLAWKEGPPSLAAEAQHDLCAFLISRGYLTEAEDRARRALRWYPKNHPRLPFFAADVALLFVLERNFLAAARILKVVVKLVDRPAPRAVILALFARALSGAGFDFEAESLRRRSLRLLEKNPLVEPLTRWHLADAERLGGRWDIAEQDARRAIEASEELNDRETEIHARRLLAAIASREVAAPRPPRSDDEFRDLVNSLRTRIAEWSPRRARPPRPPWGTDWAA